MKREITLKQTGYYITGYVIAYMWGGGEGKTQMDDATITGKITKDKIVNSLNDGRFGVEGLKSADIDVYDLFENGYKEYNRPMFITERNCSKVYKLGI